MSVITAWDSAVVMFVYNNLRCGFLDVFMKFITAVGNKGIIWIALAVILLLMGRKMRPMAFTLIFSLIISAVICSGIIKPLAGRIRPYDALSIPLIINHMNDYSFPSGHTSAAFAAATAVFIYNKKAGAALYIFAALMAFSRLYLSVHYPTDILAGAAIGIMCGVFANLTVRKLILKKTLKG